MGIPRRQSGHADESRTLDVTAKCSLLNQAKRIVRELCQPTAKGRQRKHWDRRRTVPEAPASNGSDTQDSENVCLAVCGGVYELYEYALTALIRAGGATVTINNIRNELCDAST